MRKLTTALALILATSASSAFAFDPADMHMGRTMLETQIKNAFVEYGIDYDLTALSLAQIAQIEGILSDPERDSGGNGVKSAVEAIIRNN
jgi:hypothetical protein